MHLACLGREQARDVEMNLPDSSSCAFDSSDVLVPAAAAQQQPQKTDADEAVVFPRPHTGNCIQKEHYRLTSSLL